MATSVITCSRAHVLVCSFACAHALKCSLFRRAGVEENAAAADFDLPKEEMLKLDALDTGIITRITNRRH